jgi:hypothetical protein
VFDTARSIFENVWELPDQQTFACGCMLHFPPLDYKQEKHHLFVCLSQISAKALPTKLEG